MILTDFFPNLYFKYKDRPVQRTIFNACLVGVFGYFFRNWECGLPPFYSAPLCFNMLFFYFIVLFCAFRTHKFGKIFVRLRYFSVLFPLWTHKLSSWWLLRKNILEAKVKRGRRRNDQERPCFCWSKFFMNCCNCRNKMRFSNIYFNGKIICIEYCAFCIKRSKLFLINEFLLLNSVQKMYFSF